MNKTKVKDFTIENVRGHFIVSLDDRQLSVEDSHTEAEQFIDTYIDSLKEYIIYYEYLDKDDRWIFTHTILFALSEDEAKKEFESKNKRIIRSVDVRLS